MDPKAKLLIIDDDSTLVSTLEMYLVREGFEVHLAPNGAEGLRAFYALRPDLVVLDVMMPQMDGWEACRRIRELSTAPILMLTARGQEGDRVMGLKLGADDYVAKPFSLKELVARIEAILRRTRMSNPNGKGGAVYVSDNLIIDAQRWEVRRDGKPVELTSTELRLLFYMAENAGQVLSHRQLLEHVWGSEYVDNVDYTKLYVWRLRQKLEDDPSAPRYLITERGIGYRLVRPD